jgi:hypothetical protein
MRRFVRDRIGLAAAIRIEKVRGSKLIRRSDEGKSAHDKLLTVMANGRVGKRDSLGPSKSLRRKKLPFSWARHAGPFLI